MAVWGEPFAWSGWVPLLTLLALMGTLAVNAGVWWIAYQQHSAARPRLRIRALELGNGDVIVDLVNERGRDGAVRDIFTMRRGLDGHTERYVLDVLDVTPDQYGRRHAPRDYLVRSGDRRRFYCPATAKVYRWVEDRWMPTPRRPTVEPWFGSDGGPATLHVEPVFGEGHIAPMPLHFVDGSPASE